MDRLLEKLWNLVARDQTLSMQRRLYRMVCLITSLLCLVVILPLNYLQDLPPVINLGVLFFGLFTLYLYRASFRGRDHVIIYYLVLILLLDIIWFPNGGSTGSIMYYFAAATVYPMVLSRGRARWMLIGGQFLNIAALLAIEHVAPSLVVPFVSPAARSLDLLVGLFCSMLAGTMTLWVVITNYDWEHGIIARVSTDLAAGEKNYREVVETVNAAILRMDRTGTVSFFNACAEHLFGLNRAEVLGQSAAALFPPVAEQGDGGPVRFEHLLQAPHRQAHVESEFTRADGRTIWIAWTIQPVFNDNQDLVEFLCLGSDMTERRALEERRKELDRHQLHVQKIESLGVLAGGIAHDFNNILAGILGNISLVRLDLDPSSDAHHRLGEAENASMHARDLTQQLLTFSRGGLPVKSVISLDRVLRDAVRFSLRGSNMGSSLDIAPDLWAVDADTGQIGQVFNNLIINACQAMPSGGTVTVRAANVLVGEQEEPALAPGRYVMITVADTGIGIMPEHVQRIFDPYFTTKQSGSGLGLAVSFSIVRSHHGGIAVRSALGKGSLFTVHLPAADRMPSEPQAVKPVAERSGIRVLVMDDEPVVRDTAGAMLRRFGYAVEFAADGAEAVERYRHAAGTSERFDVVLMDLTIPGGMGGKQAIDRLREIDPAVRAVASSGYSNDPIMANYREHGFSGVISKPYRPSDLNSVLQHVLGQDPSCSA